VTRDPRLFAFLAVGHALDHLVMLLFPTAALAIERAWGMSYAELLALGTAGFVAFGIGSLPAGWLADRWSRSGMMAVFFIGTGLATVLTGLARDPLELAIGLTLIGLFASIYHPVGIAMVVDVAERPGKALGVNGVFGNLGVALAAGVAGTLAGLIHWRAAFLVPGAVTALLGLAFLRRAASPEDARPRAAVARGTDPDIRRVLSVVAVVALCGGIVFTAMTVALPKILEERVTGLGGLIGIGGAATLVFAVASLAQIASGRLLDRIGARIVLIVVAGLQLPLFLLAVGADGLPMLGLGLLLMLLVFGEVPVGDWLIGRHASPAWRSRVLAVKFVLGLGMGALALPMIATLHATFGGFAPVFVALALLVVPITLAATLLPPHRPRPVPALQTG
jgi:MFS family permease